MKRRPLPVTTPPASYGLRKPSLIRLGIALGLTGAAVVAALYVQPIVYVLVLAALGLGIVLTSLVWGDYPIPLVASTLAVLVPLSTLLTRGLNLPTLAVPSGAVLLACIVFAAKVVDDPRAALRYLVFMGPKLALVAVPIVAVFLLLRTGPYGAIGGWVTTAIVAVLASCLRRDTASDPMGSGEMSDSWPCVQLWNQHLAWADPETEKGAPLAGYVLTEPPSDVVDQRDGETPIGWETTVICPPASKGASVVRSRAEEIATTMQVSPADIEVIPTANHARPLLRVIHRSVLAGGSVPWTPGGVDEIEGTIELGTYADGMRSKYQLWERNGQTWHGWFCGGTGSGKSTAMHGLLARALYTGQVVLDLVPIGGGSMYAWKDRAFRYGDTIEAAEAALARGVAVMDARSQAAADIEWYDLRAQKMRRGRDPLPPGAEWPVYWVVLDEFPRLQQSSSKATVQHFKRIAAEGRKWRVALLVASQGATVKETWWNDSVIRENIRQGNVAVFRGSKGSATMALDGIELASGVSDIPPGMGGMGYVLSKASQRAMPSRVDWIADDDDRPENVPSSWEVAEFAKVVEPNPVDMAAITPLERSWIRSVA